MKQPDVWGSTACVSSAVRLGWTWVSPVFAYGTRRAGTSIRWSRAVAREVGHHDVALGPNFISRGVGAGRSSGGSARRWGRLPFEMLIATQGGKRFSESGRATGSTPARPLPEGGSCDEELRRLRNTAPRRRLFLGLGTDPQGYDRRTRKWPL